MANTVIFKWNPAISSYGMCALLDDIINHTLGGNWSVWDYENVRKGDTFFMLKVGKGQNGVVMRGKITSDPYVDEDWSGQGRKVYYCDFLADIIINPDTFSLLNSEELNNAIPDFEWFGGHSGVILNEEQSSKLSALWKEYLKNSREEFRARWDLIKQRDMWHDQLALSYALRKKLFIKPNSLA